MALFQYKGLSKTGKEVKDNITCETLQQAKNKVQAMGIMLIDIKEQKSDSLKKQSTLSFGTRISVADLSLMTRQLATLVKARIQIVDAFSALIDQVENPQLKIVISEIRQKVNEGSSMANALSDYPKIFNSIYVNMVEAGETSGTLHIVLIRLAEFTEAQVKLRNKIKSSMTYPVIMMVVGAILMGVIFVFVIPKITKIFITMKKKLPLQTEICIWLSNFIRDYWWGIIIGVFGGYFMFKKYISSGKGRERWHKLLLKLPIVGKLTMMINVSRFCSTLATLLDSGVPILTSMKIVTNLVANIHMQRAVENAKQSVSEGASITGPLVKSGYFPPMVTHMIRLGEKSGELEPMLQIVAENYEEQVDSRLSGLTSVLEPIMMVCMGLVVAFIVFSVVVPMMDLSSLGKK